jgi:hypothetical protein
MMYEIFIRTQSLFETLREALEGTTCKVVFQRFEGPWGDAGFRVADLRKTPWKDYNEGGYSVIYVSKGKAPAKPTDWAFLDKEAARLIEIAGGRTEKKALEMSVLRPMAKKSEMEALFKKLTRLLDKASTKGARLNGQPYPKIRIETGAEDLELYEDLKTKTIRATPA